MCGPDPAASAFTVHDGTVHADEGDAVELWTESKGLVPQRVSGGHVPDSYQFDRN